jgi:hypothetical protein
MGGCQHRCALSSLQVERHRRVGTQALTHILRRIHRVLVRRTLLCEVTLVSTILRV